MMAAVLACRNQSSRLYGKPLQNLDVDNNISILDFMIEQLLRPPEIDQIVLAISENEENLVYKTIAERHGLPYVIGDDYDVLGRLIKGAELVGADDVFRVTTESPYTYLDNLTDVLAHHRGQRIDYSYVKSLPDGAFFEIISTGALKRSWDEGESRHRSELCTLYINEHEDSFTIAAHEVPEGFRRADIRLTVDWPEDLIVLRAVYTGLGLAPDKPVSLEEIIAYLDANPKINAINNWIDSGVGRIWY